MTLLGTPAQLEAASLAPRARGEGELRHLRRTVGDRVRVAAAQAAAFVGAALRVVLAVGLLLLVVSALVLHFAYHRPGMSSRLSLRDAVYFTVEWVATVGFGDFSFSNQSAGLEVFGIALIIAGTTLVTTLFAPITNALVSRRLAQSLGQARIPGMLDHVVLVGLGAVGIRVLDRLLARGCPVVVVERDESNRYLAEVRSRRVPLVLGDATLGPTLDNVNLERARAVAILTSDDLVNLETGLSVRDRLAGRWPGVPTVPRVQTAT